ncbi:D-2-hydroxyacid dehydrogenase family protein [Alkalihalobacillus sp. BA299]|uniref:D-2-hydroxyacid dehydrogenase family protein n=1 Tax=Alkalihalobacillus sp. BA299 TaxID=2815938 RepID=UPI001ADC3410|nr:D-2-hydroxyacid dehydrogenase family protein [Alkalihalobacillus sp. BA299]
MKIVILDDWENITDSVGDLDKLRKFADVLIYHDQPTVGTLKERLQYVDIIVLFRERTKITKEILDAMNNIKLIAQTGTGLAHLDLYEINKRGIPVSTTPGGSIAAMTELTFTFILALSRNLFNLTTQMKEGVWPLTVGCNLSKKTIGIIGLGKIGSSVANIAKAFGMRVIAWGPTLTQERAASVGVEYVSLEQLLQESHFVTVHLRLNENTKQLLNAKHFELMREDAYFINTSRGQIINEDALVEALQKRSIRGAGLDVFTKEPLEPNHPLLKLDNVVLSPHIGWKTDETFDNFIKRTVENIESFYIYNKPINIANQQYIKQELEEKR